MLIHGFSALGIDLPHLSRTTPAADDRPGIPAYVERCSSVVVDEWSLFFWDAFVRTHKDSRKQLLSKTALPVSVAHGSVCLC